MSNLPGATPTGPGGGDRALTGITGLYAVLAGGLPRDRLYLVEGTPGTGKTTLALQFLLEGQRLGERGMYVTLSETAELRASAASHGWSLDGISIVELVPEAGIGSEQEQTLLHPAEFELGETTGRILERIEQERPARLVLDSLSELRLLAQTPSADPRAEAPLHEPSLHRAAARRPEHPTPRPAATQHRSRRDRAGAEQQQVWRGAAILERGEAARRAVPRWPP